MGLFDDLKNDVLGNVLGTGNLSGNNKTVMEALVGLASSGGIQKILDLLNKAGLTDKVKSWIGNGDNIPVSADEIKDALGTKILKPLSEKTGLDVSDIAQSITEILPDLINKFTPNGKVDLDHIKNMTKDIDVGEIGGFLKGLLK
jgi:uncharacterized protein YidB (DUF937 family)